MNNENSPPSPNDETTPNMVFEQYKMLVESINRINDTREVSNNFWVATNGFGVSALAYMRDAQNIHQHHKSFLLTALIIMGTLFCVSWLSYLGTIKKSVEIRSELLVKLEKNFPLPIFSEIFSRSAEKAGKAALTVKEMLIPSVFLMGYLFFAVLLFFFPQEVMSTR
jgi:hypothetical protein